MSNLAALVADFPRCLRSILREEGGNDDDPHDHGGRTSRGVIQREWDAFRKTHPGRPADVWKASDDDIALIYHQQYWEPYCGKMPSGVNLCFFNASVNSGRFQATKELQRALGVGDDGWIGIVTLTALGKYRDLPTLIRNLSNRRRNFYRSLKQFDRYGRGWLARTDRIERDALALLANKPTARRREAIAPEDLGRAKARAPKPQDWDRF